MTVIVAVSDGSRVCMACDSQVTNGGAKLTLSAPKIVRRGGLLFGPCDGPTIQAIRHGMPDSIFPIVGFLVAGRKVTEGGIESGPPWSLNKWVLSKFLPWLRTTLRDEKILTVQNGAEELRCNMIIAAGAKFVVVDNDGYVVECDEPFNVVGSGWREARGAMWAESRPDSLRTRGAEYIARAGVEAAIALDSGCGLPVCVEWTEPRP